MTSLQTIGVIGAGTMGNGIAQACAVAGFSLMMIDVDDAAVARGSNAVASIVEDTRELNLRVGDRVRIDDGHIYRI